MVRWQTMESLSFDTTRHRREEMYDPVILVGVERDSTSQMDANDLGNAVGACLANCGILSDVPVLVYEVSVWDMATGTMTLDPEPLIPSHEAPRY